MKEEASGLERGEGIGTPSATGPLSVASGPGTWRLRERRVSLASPRVAGILNLTPDSFSDGGEIPSLEAAVERALAMEEEGAALLDVGGESTRPGADEVPVEVELQRVLPFLEAVRGRIGIPLSVDTRRAVVARAAVRAGAEIINDVSGFRHDPETAEAAAESGAGVVLSHMRGTPATMRQLATYGDVVGEVREELRESLSLARAAGVDPERIVVDPGIGFAKTAAQSMLLLREVGALSTLGRPVLVGPSRKSFIGEVTGRAPRERGPGTLAACVLAYAGGARIFRVHDVAPAVQALAVAEAILSRKAATG